MVVIIKRLDTIVIIYFIIVIVVIMLARTHTHTLTWVLNNNVTNARNDCN